MRRLLINDELRDIAADYKKAMSLQFRTKPVDKLKDLQNRLDKTADADEITYIQHIIDEYDKIIRKRPIFTSCIASI
jgi:hypothetical protein